VVTTYYCIGQVFFTPFLTFVIPRTSFPTYSWEFVGYIVVIAVFFLYAPFVFSLGTNYTPAATIAILVYISIPMSLM
jgi:hypothetical protein